LDAARRRSMEPERLIRELLDGIDFFSAATYATLFYGLLLPDGRLRYVNAGHPPPFLLGHGRCERLDATGLFLSTAFRSRPPQAREIALRPGDRLLIHTDGAFEARNPADQELGLDRLESAFDAGRHLPVPAALEALLARVRSHSGGRPIDDDVTFLMVERTG
jgi:phosphoserine phosphatase RsbU/P